MREETIYPGWTGIRSARRQLARAPFLQLRAGLGAPQIAARRATAGSTGQAGSTP
jgi:hypothetical protein